MWWLKLNKNLLGAAWLFVASPWFLTDTKAECLWRDGSVSSTELRQQLYPFNVVLGHDTEILCFSSLLHIHSYRWLSLLAECSNSTLFLINPYQAWARIWTSVMTEFFLMISSWCGATEVEIQSREKAEFTKCDRTTAVVGGEYLYGNSSFCTG